MKSPSWVWQSAVSAVLIGAGAVAVTCYPSRPATVFVVVTAVSFVALLLRNPDFWLRRLATGLFASAAAIAAVPDVLTYVVDSDRTWLANLQAASPLLVGMFLVAGITVAWFETRKDLGGPVQSADARHQTNTAALSGGEIKGNVTISQSNIDGGG